MIVLTLNECQAAQVRLAVSERRNYCTGKAVALKQRGNHTGHDVMMDSAGYCEEVISQIDLPRHAVNDN